MGLFSAKEYVCERCGKTFSKRVNLNGNFCDDCYSEAFREENELKEKVQGYVDYMSQVFFKSYSLNELREIPEHREAIVEKYTETRGISRQDLGKISAEYKKLSEEEIRETIARVIFSSVQQTIGAAYTDNFFLPSSFGGTIVDAESVFAVGITRATNIDAGSSEAILCAVFTNDPYIPVFPMVFIGKRSLLDGLSMKSKKGRAAVVAFFERVCPNLTYPVLDIKELKRIIKAESTIKGNIDQKTMINFMNDASSGSSIFNGKKIGSFVSYRTQELLDRMGYIAEEEISKILRMDNMFNRNFWEKQIKKLSGN